MGTRNVLAEVRPGKLDSRFFLVVFCAVPRASFPAALDAFVPQKNYWPVLGN
jgi:hypothetical protein